MLIRVFMVSNHLDMNRGCPANLTDNQWQILQKILESTLKKRKYFLRDIMDCILYINKMDCQWQMLPKYFSPYNLVFYYFTKRKREGAFEDIMDMLREKLRVTLGREKCPECRHQRLKDSQDLTACGQGVRHRRQQEDKRQERSGRGRHVGGSDGRLRP